MTDKVRPSDVEEETGVDAEDVEAVLWYLVNNGWLFSNHFLTVEQEENE